MSVKIIIYSGEEYTKNRLIEIFQLLSKRVNFYNVYGQRHIKSGEMATVIGIFEEQYEKNKPLLYMEDVGRHNAVDKIAGYMYRHKITGADKIFYTTGRLTSEMVIKTVQMGIPILVSRSGFTAWGVDLARQVGLTLIGRAKGKRFVALAGEDRIEFDADLNTLLDEPKHSRRKGGDE